ncbi:uncharacterized protein J3R85_005439 [Psidium guajava]|nr:uncharacterized protein J3R85_005439 [Psidium guajava]
MFRPEEFPPLPSLQAASSSPTQHPFPPTKQFSDTDHKYFHAPKITSITIGPDGRRIAPAPAELTLNWQTENSLAQNAALSRIEANTVTIQKLLTASQTQLNDLLQERMPRSYLEDKTLEVSSLKKRIALLEKQLQKATAPVPEDPFFRIAATNPFARPSSSISTSPLQLQTPSFSGVMPSVDYARLKAKSQEVIQERRRKEERQQRKEARRLAKEKKKETESTPSST